MFYNGTNATNNRPLIISDLEKVLVTSGLAILIIMTIFGNTLVIIAFITYRPLRSITNYFIISLSISDILVAVISMPVWITFVMIDMNFSIYEGKLLKVWTCVDITTGVASILNLTAISVDRCIHIMKPLNYSKVVTRKRVTNSILIIWIFSISLSLAKGLHWKWQKPIYEMTIFTIGFASPLTVIVFCYVKIYGAVNYHLKKFKTNRCLNGTKKKENFKNDLKAIKSIALVVLAFFICWCPFFILNIVHGWCRCRIDHHVVTFAKWLHYSNSVINPIIYACFNKDYRDGFKKALRKHLYTIEFSSFPSLINRNSMTTLQSLRNELLRNGKNNNKPVKISSV